MDLLEEGELEQYQRHLSLQGFGQTCQSSLKNSSVLVVGAGGLGCPALQYLTAAGVGKIGIIDDDVVEISNLQRQVLFDHADQGMLKAEVAANKLRKLNPYISIDSYCERLTSKNCESIFKKYDLILDGTDNFSTRYLINDASVLFQRPLIHGSIHQFEGMVTVFNLNNKGPTYRCLFPEQPDPTSIPTCADAGVLGVLPGVIGCWQALEAIKVLSNIGEPLWRKILLFNALTQSVRTIHFDPVPENLKIDKLPEPIDALCSSRSSNDSFKEITEHQLLEMMKKEKDLQILDVREHWERDLSRIEPSIHLPLGRLKDIPTEIPNDLHSSQKLVIYCKAGIRSRIACQVFRKNGFSQLYNLSNGMDGWMNCFPNQGVNY